MARAWTIWLGLAAVALVVALLGLALGSATPDPRTAWAAWSDPSHPAHAIVMQLRWPRVAAGFTVGALLALSGALLQILLRNPLAEPYVLGLSGGAALGALTAISLVLPAFVVSGAAAAGAMASLALLLLIARREFGGDAVHVSGERLLLSGVMLAALWAACIALVLSLSSESRVQGMIQWLMGDLAGVRPIGWEAAALVIVLILACMDAARLNVLARGDLIAASLGVRVGALKLRIVIWSAIAAGTAVSVAGTIGFVGLIAPHLVRRIWGNDQRMLLPAAALLGGTLVAGADTIARNLLAPQQLPVGAVTAALGAPIFLFLLSRRAS